METSRLARFRATILAIHSRIAAEPWRCRVLAPLILVALASLGVTQQAAAQGAGIGNFGTLGGVEPQGQYPNNQYYLALRIYRSGDLANAVNAFEASLRGSRRDINGRWIDAIPSLAMLAECYWHLGNLQACREQTDLVFDIAIRNRGWLGRVDWQTSVQPGIVRAKPNWLWPEAASINQVNVADRIMFISGNQLTEQSLVRGGAIEELNVRSMDVAEIMRGLATASYRRRVILGPLSQDDPLSVNLLESTKFPANLQLPAARSLIGSMRTTGYFAEGNDKRVGEEAARSATVGGSVHGLTPVALLAQASAMASMPNSDAVIPIAANVANSAALLEQHEWIGEAMQLAAGCASEARAASVAQMASAAAIATNRESRLCSLHCMLAAADAFVTAGDLDAADVLLVQSQALAARRDVFQPRLGTYGAYIQARIAAARGASIGVGKTTELDTAISRMQAFAINHRDRKRTLVSMPRLYQLGLIGQSIGQAMGANTSEQWLSVYCDDPSIDVWRRDPVDALSAMWSDRSAAHAARINLAATSGYGERLLLAVDSMLAARFVDRLPLGGRVAQVRALARVSDQDAAPEWIEFRKFAGRGLADVRTGAQNMPDPNAITVENLEAKACAVALARLSFPQVAIPRLDVKKPLDELPPRTGLLTYTSVGNRVYATFSADGKTSMWTVGGGNRLSGDITGLMRSLGVGKTRGARLPEDASWKDAAIKLRSQLLPDDQIVTAQRLDHLVVVPDGPLWYLPFEVLPIGDGSGPLIGEAISVRYAPTPGLALRAAGPAATKPTVAISADQFFAPRDADLNETIVASIVDTLADPLRLPGALDLPTGLLGDRAGHLVIASIRNAQVSTPLLTGLAGYDQSSPYGTIAAWMRFPAKVPASVSLFGLRTPIDLGQAGTGDELFAMLCGLHAAGVRDVMLSRWAVGGESSAMLVREFLQELPFMGMNDAWQRALMHLRQAELNPAAEPLVTKAEYDREGVTGAEPLFWAGYLISSPPSAAKP